MTFDEAVEKIIKNNPEESPRWQQEIRAKAKKIKQIRMEITETEESWTIKDARLLALSLKKTLYCKQLDIPKHGRKTLDFEKIVELCSGVQYE